MVIGTVSKSFSFHSAHRLPNHQGQCRRMHGHTYTLEVFVTGMIGFADGASDEGMIIDFSDLKRIYKEKVEPLVEHQNLNETLVDTNIPRSSSQVAGVRSDNEPPLTTCENMAVWLLDVFSLELLTGNYPRVRNVAIRLWETPTSFAEVGDTPWRG